MYMYNEVILVTIVNSFAKILQTYTHNDYHTLLAMLWGEGNKSAHYHPNKATPMYMYMCT